MHDGTATPMWFGVLGPLEVRVGEHQITLPRAQTRALLALLVLEVGRDVPTARMIEALWAGAAPATATTQIHNGISVVRRTLREAAGRDLVLRQPGGYRLDAPDECVDLAVFHELTARARRQAGAEAARTFREALSLWRGRPLSGINGAFTDPEADRLAQLRADASEALFEIELSLGRHRELQSDIAALLREHPLRQKLAAQLMLAHYRSGRQPEALAVYRDLRQRLADELGTEPVPDIVVLHRQILDSDVRVAAAPAEPQRRYLPRDLPDFTGRAEEMAELDQVTAAAAGGGAVVISAVAGVGGVGKTTLAVHWAHQHAADYPDGQLHVDLHGFGQGPPTTPVAALSALLQALGVPPEKISADLDTTAALYRATTADRRLLVILDNARSADQVRPLLPTGRGSLAVITSRDSLAGLVVSDGARLLALRPLPDDDSIALLTAILGPSRIAGQAAAVADLAALCGHLPLALRIAAANLLADPARPIADMAAELRSADRLQLLSLAGTDTWAVEAVFEQSYRMLDEPDQRVFHLLGLHPGTDVTAEAVAALTSIPMDEAEAALGRLVQASLVIETSPARYLLHDLVKVYAAAVADRERTPAERATAFRALADFYIDTTASAAELVTPWYTFLTMATHRNPAHIDVASAMGWIQSEQDNLVTLARHTADHGPADVAWRLADLLRGYFVLRRDHAAWQVMGAAGLAAASAEGHTAAQAAMHLGIGTDLRLEGHLEKAVAHLTEGLRLTRAARWRGGELSAVLALATYYGQHGDPQAAIELLESVATSSTSEHPALMAVALANLGAMRLTAGDLRRAAGDMERALALLEATGNKMGVAFTRTNLGLVQLDLGRLDTAETYLEQAIALDEEIANPSGPLPAMAGLADLQLRSGRLREAAQSARRTLARAEREGIHRYRCVVLIILAHVERLHSRLAEARKLAEQALEIAREISTPYMESDALDALAQIYQAQNRPQSAREHAQESLAIAEAENAQALVAKALTTLAELDLAAGRRDSAAEYARRARKICDDTGIEQCRPRLTAVLSQ
ncbi:DNA-binding SARP family transcriptional activator/Tfp pilus assembly protein PilF [Hamadaea flava]|uniref:BTAD domain-containing putative transcriptional regulator n=1 Tax=Hamadaea flava TaxID=1742688 RepID=A0ABV8LQE0_9ACTN|nr:BTAD domain-containing putative transcriptional regulator [Hamadaea flava]MCP2322853.1 DNA-binding SARP family transcriptional activator/Tfp pilus assembly protein PilF [Hamadaea flava]